MSVERSVVTVGGTMNVNTCESKRSFSFTNLCSWAMFTKHALIYWWIYFSLLYVVHFDNLRTIWWRLSSSIDCDCEQGLFNSHLPHHFLIFNWVFNMSHRNRNHYKLCSLIRQTNRVCRQLNRFPIHAIKPQYFEEGWSSLTKFPLCALNTFQSGNLVLFTVSWDSTSGVTNSSFGE